MASNVFPIARYVYIALTFFWLQALFLVPFNNRIIQPGCAYLVFTVNIIIIGIIAVQAIRALDPSHVVDLVLDGYFNE